MKPYIINVLTILIIFSFNSCNKATDPILDPFVEAMQNAISIVDNGIIKIQNESGAWRNTLETISNELPKEVRETIRSDMRNFVDRSVAATNNGVHCTVDFLAARAIQSLKYIKTSLENELALYEKRASDVKPLVLPPPQFCQVIPNAINLSTDPESWSTVTLHGYDLDHGDTLNQKLSVFLINKEGATFALPESHIGRTTHYQATLNLGELESFLYHHKIHKIITSWNNSTDGNPEIVVLKWKPKRKTEITGISRLDYMPPNNRGDEDFNTSSGKEMHIVVRGEIRIQETHIDCRTYLFAHEPRPDYTTAVGGTAWSRAYTAPPKWKIVGVTPEVNSEHRSSISNHGAHDYHRPNGEVVEYFKVFGDRRGDDAGSYTKVETNWRSLSVTLEETEPPWYDEKKGIVIDQEVDVQAPTIPPPVIKSTLLPNEILSNDAYISSPNGRFQLIMQSDGNLVLYEVGVRAKWASGTDGRGIQTCIFQGDGNFVLYGFYGGAVWNSGTNGNANSRLILQDDGNLVIYSSSGVPIWNTGV